MGDFAVGGGVEELLEGLILRFVVGDLMVGDVMGVARVSFEKLFFDDFAYFLVFWVVDDEDFLQALDGLELLELVGDEALVADEEVGHGVFGGEGVHFVVLALRHNHGHIRL